MNLFRSLIIFCLLSLNALADQYHYRNILIGERASGMGGAYLAISDDPSGIFHNPAGILFSFEDYFSLSANGLSQSTLSFKNVFGSAGYNYVSRDWVPNFFGFTQNVGKSKWGFAIIVPNSDLFDQDDEIYTHYTGVGDANFLKRKFFRQNRTYLFGPAFATELVKDFTLGFSLFGLYNSHKVMDYQLVFFNADAGGKQRFLHQQMSFSQESYGLQPKIGVQWMPMAKLSLGAVASKTITVSSKFDKSISKNVTTDLTYTGADATVTHSTSSPAIISPLEVGIGAALFPSKRLSFSGDFYYYTQDDNFSDFKTSSIYNFALGMEYTLTESFALRAGAYTNNSNTPVLEQGKQNQPEHIDLMGATLSFSFIKPGSSFTLGTVFAKGSGQGQVIGDTTLIQDAEQTQTTIFLTGSYQL